MDNYNIDGFRLLCSRIHFFSKQMYSFPITKPARHIKLYKNKNIKSLKRINGHINKLKIKTDLVKKKHKKTKKQGHNNVKNKSITRHIYIYISDQ